MSQLHSQSAVVRSLEHERASRDHRRFLRLQAQFARLGFGLDPLCEGQLLVQRWGLCRVLDLNEAERLLRLVGSAR